MSIGQAAGENKAINAVKQALFHPLLEDISLVNASGIIVNFTSGSDLTLMDISQALGYLESHGGLLSSAELSVVQYGIKGVERQWDYPNGWAPHQMLVWRALHNYGHHEIRDRLIYKWQPAQDDYASSYKDSVMFPFITERTGMSTNDLQLEIEQRKRVLHWMREQSIRSYKDVAAIIAEYYARPEEFYAKVLKGELKTLATAKNS